MHHTLYPTGCEGSWDVPSDLLLCLCEAHHRQRQEVEQRILMSVARRLCLLNLRGLQAIASMERPNVDTLLHGTPVENSTGAPGSIPPTQMDFMVNDQRL